MGGSQGAGGNVVLAFFVSNVSADTCRVHGAPLPETLDAEGAVLREGAACTSLSAAGDCESTVTVLPPAPVPAPSAGRYEAGFVISWGNALLFGTPCPGTAASLALLLPDDGGTIVIRTQAFRIVCPPERASFISLRARPHP